MRAAIVPQGAIYVVRCVARATFSPLATSLTLAARGDLARAALRVCGGACVVRGKLYVGEKSVIGLRATPCAVAMRAWRRSTVIKGRACVSARAMYTVS